MVSAMCDVLVLGDEPLLRMTVADILADAGYAVARGGQRGEGLSGAD